MTSHVQAGAARSGVLTVVFNTFAGLARRMGRRRTLARLEDLDDRLLRDIGLSRWDVTVMRRHW